MENWRNFKNSPLTLEDLENIRIFSEEIELLTESMHEGQLLEEGVIADVFSKLSNKAKAGFEKLKGITLKGIIEKMEGLLAKQEDPETFGRKAMNFLKDNAYAHDISNSISIYKAWKAGEEVNPEKLKRFVTFFVTLLIGLLIPSTVIANMLPAAAKAQVGAIGVNAIVLAIGGIIGFTVWSLSGSTLGKASEKCAQGMQFTGTKTDMKQITGCMVGIFKDKVKTAVQKIKAEPEAASSMDIFDPKYDAPTSMDPELATWAKSLEEKMKLNKKNLLNKEI